MFEEHKERKIAGYNLWDLLYGSVKKISAVGIVYFVGYMHWSLAWLITPAILLAIRDQWRHENILKRNIAKASALANEKDVILARIEDLPAWVYFPDVERAEWINQIFKQLWPNVNQFVRAMLRDSIQPKMRVKLEKYKLSGFQFERMILGTIPPRIGGIKVYDKNVARDEIIMDVDIFYAGDCDITFLLSGIKGGIKDLQIHGMLRVVMKPLITTVPLVGGLQLFFLNNPSVDFNLVGVADILDMPGLSDMLRKIVVEQVASMMVLPNYFPIKLSHNVDSSTLKTPEPEGILRIHVVEAKKLMKKDIGMLGKGKSDPYAVLTVGAQEFKTKVINNNVDPKWDFWCEFKVMESSGQQLFIHVWDSDDLSKNDESLGRATVEIANIVKKGQDDMWITLDQAKHGMIHIRCTWLELSSNYSDLKLAIEETQMLRLTTMSTALLIIYIDSAMNLPQARTSSKPDCYVIVQVNKVNQQTEVKMRTDAPVWEHGFSFFVANPETDSLHLTVMDQKTDTQLGYVTYNLSALSEQTGLEIVKQPFRLMKSGPESTINLSMHLKIFRQSKPIGDQPAATLPRQESTASTASADVPVPSEEAPLIRPPRSVEEEVAIPEVADEVIKPVEKSTVAAGLVHRQPSVISSAGDSGLGKIQLTLRYSVQRQRLIIVIHKIANLPLKDPSNIPDPYVKLYLLPERSKESKRKTQVIKDNCNPIFDDCFEYLLSQGELNSKQLEVTVASQKHLFVTGTGAMGQVVIDLPKLNLTQPYTSWFDLQPGED